MSRHERKARRAAARSPSLPRAGSEGTATNLRVVLECGTAPRADQVLSLTNNLSWQERPFDCAGRGYRLVNTIVLTCVPVSYFDGARSEIVRIRPLFDFIRRRVAPFPSFSFTRNRTRRAPMARAMVVVAGVFPNAIGMGSRNEKAPPRRERGRASLSRLWGPEG